MSTPDTAGVIAPPPLIALAAIACAALLEWIAPIGWIAGAPPIVRWLVGGALVLSAVALIAAAILRFTRAGTPVPTRSPTTALVTTGVYAAMRNPIYVGFFCLLLGIAVLAAWDWLAPLAFVCMAVIHWGVVRREELYLAAKFGDAYAAYKSRVRRYGLF